MCAAYHEARNPRKQQCQNLWYRTGLHLRPSLKLYRGLALCHGGEQGTSGKHSIDPKGPGGMTGENIYENIKRRIKKTKQTKKSLLVP